MKVGILGAGNVGSRIAELLRAAQHDVVVGSRNGDTSLSDAANHGDIVLVAVHYHAAAEVLKNLADVLPGKIVVDATNPLNDDWSPLLLGEENSAGEEIARQLRETVWPHLDAGRVAPVMDSTFPLAEAAAAHARMESSAHIGKIVLEV